MKTLEQTYHIQASPAKVWLALTVPEEIEGWGGGPAVMDDRVGTAFSLWGGSIWGTNTEMIPAKELAQDWYDTELPQPTKLTMTLEPEGEGGTKLTLVHTDIPDDRTSDIEEGWQQYYLGPLKEYLER